MCVCVCICVCKPYLLILTEDSDARAANLVSGEHIAVAELLGGGRAEPHQSGGAHGLADATQLELAGDLHARELVPFDEVHGDVAVETRREKKETK